MDSIKYQFNEASLDLDDDTSSMNLAPKCLSDEELLAITADIEKAVDEIPTSHIFSDTVLQRIATVVTSFVENPDFLTSKAVSSIDTELNSHSDTSVMGRNLSTDKLVMNFVQSRMAALDSQISVLLLKQIDIIRNHESLKSLLTNILINESLPSTLLVHIMSHLTMTSSPYYQLYLLVLCSFISTNTQELPDQMIIDDVVTFYRKQINLIDLCDQIDNTEIETNPGMTEFRAILVSGSGRIMSTSPTCITLSTKNESARFVLPTFVFDQSESAIRIQSNESVVGDIGLVGVNEMDGGSQQFYHVVMPSSRLTLHYIDIRIVDDGRLCISDDTGAKKSISLDDKNSSDFCLYISLQSHCSVTVDYCGSQITEIGRISVTDTCLHLEGGMIQAQLPSMTEISTISSDWFLEIGFRFWQFNKSFNIFKMIYNSMYSNIGSYQEKCCRLWITKQTVVLEYDTNQTVSLSIVDGINEGELLFIKAEFHTGSVSLMLSRNKDDIVSLKEIKQNICIDENKEISIEIGDSTNTSVIWDLMTCRIQSSINSLFSLMLPPIHTISLHSLTSFISCNSGDHTIECKTINTYWLSTSPPSFTSSSLISVLNALNNDEGPHSVRNWDSVLISYHLEKIGKYKIRYDFECRIRSILYRHKQVTNTPYFCLPNEDITDIILLLLIHVSKSHIIELLHLIDVCLYMHTPSLTTPMKLLFNPLYQILFDVAPREDKQEKRARFHSENAQQTGSFEISEENQSDEILAISDHSIFESESAYSRILQIIASHFDILFPTAESQLDYLTSLSLEVATRPLIQNVKSTSLMIRSVGQDLLQSICQNRFLITNVIAKWIPRNEAFIWKRKQANFDVSKIRFDHVLSCDGVSIDSSGFTVINTNSNRQKYNISLISPPMDSGIYEITYKLVDDRNGDEMVCFGFAIYPMDSFNYEESNCLWVYRCFNGELYAKGKRISHCLDKLHPGVNFQTYHIIDGLISFVFDMINSTVSIRINSHDFGIVFDDIPQVIYPVVLFYNSQPPQRSVKIMSVKCISESLYSESVSVSADPTEIDGFSGSMPALVHHLTECYFCTRDKHILFMMQSILDRITGSSRLLRHSGTYDDISPAVTSVCGSKSFVEWAEECCKMPSDLSKPLEFTQPSSSSLVISPSGYQITHKAKTPTWISHTLSLPSRQNNCWTVKVKFVPGKAINEDNNRGNEQQLMIGVVEENVDGSDENSFNSFLGCDKHSWGYKTTGQLFHGNLCSGNIIRTNNDDEMTVTLDGRNRQMRLILENDNFVTLFDSLPEKWMLAVSLWKPGDSASIELLPSHNCKDRTRWCDTIKKGEIETSGPVHDNILKYIEISMNDMISHLNSYYISESDLICYLQDYIFPLIASISLVKLSLQQYLQIADKYLLIIKRIELLNAQRNIIQSVTYSADILEFLECMLINSIIVPTAAPSPSLLPTIASQGMKDSHAFVHCLNEFQNSDNDRFISDSMIRGLFGEETFFDAEKLEEANCMEFLEGVTSRSRGLYDYLEHYYSIPVAIIKKRGELVHSLSRHIFIFYLHHTSTMDLITAFADYLTTLSSTPRLPLFLDLVWRRTVMCCSSLATDVRDGGIQINDMIDHLAWAIDECAMMYDMTDVTRPSTSISLDTEEIEQDIPVIILELYNLPRSNALLRVFNCVNEIALSSLSVTELVSQLVKRVIYGIETSLIQEKVLLCIQQLSEKSSISAIITLTKSLSPSEIQENCHLFANPSLTLFMPQSLRQRQRDGMHQIYASANHIIFDIFREMNGVYRKEYDILQKHYLRIWQYRWVYDDINFLQQIDFFTSLNSQMNAILLCSPNPTSFLLFALSEIELMTNQLISFICPYNEKGLSIMSSNSVSFTRSSIDSVHRQFRQIPAISTSIMSLTTMLFSTLQIITHNSKLTQLISPQIIFHFVRSLQLLLPHTKQGVLTWADLILSCMDQVGDETQIQIMEASRILLLQFSKDSLENDCTLRSRIMTYITKSLISAFSSMLQQSSLSDPAVILKKQREVIYLVRSLFISPIWRYEMTSELNRMIVQKGDTCTVMIEQLAACSVLGGDLLGLVEGGNGKYLPRKAEINEKNGSSIIYEQSEPCYIQSINEEKELVVIVILRTNEKKEVPFICVDSINDAEITLKSISPEIVSNLWLLFIRIINDNKKIYDNDWTHQIIYSLLKSSLLKLLYSLTNQMTAVSFGDDKMEEVVKYLLNQSSIVTKTTGISAIPFISHISMTTILQQFEIIHNITNSKLTLFPSFLSSSSSDDSLIPSSTTQWEYSPIDVDNWINFSYDDNSIIDTLIRCEIGECLVKVIGGEKFLLYSTCKKLVHIHTNAEYIIRASTSPDSRIIASLTSMGFSSDLIDMAVRSEGHDMDRCVQFILASVDSFHSPMPSDISGVTDSIKGDPSSYDSVMVHSTDGAETELPDLTESSINRIDCLADELWFQPRNKFFVSNGVFAALREENMNYLWDDTFRRDYLLYQSIRFICLLISEIGPDSGINHVEISHRITSHLTKITTICSRTLLVNLFIKSSLLTEFTSISDTITQDRFWKILKIVMLQDSTHIIYHEMQHLIAKYLEQGQYSGLIMVIMKDITKQFSLLKSGEYSESMKGIKSADFNTDYGICNSAQIRLLVWMTEIVAKTNETVHDYIEWIISLWLEICHSSKSSLLCLALENLQILRNYIISRNSVNVDNMNYFEELLIPIISPNYVISYIKTELENYPIFSDTLQLLLSLSTSFHDVTSTPDFFYHHFQPHGEICVNNRVMQPPWTIEFWLRLPAESYPPTTTLSLISGTNFSLDVVYEPNGALDIIRKIRFRYEMDSIIFHEMIPAGIWVHISIVMSSVKTECVLYVNGNETPSVVGSYPISIENIGNECNFMEFDIMELRCWNYARDIKLIKNYFAKIIDISVVNSYLTLYLTAYGCKEDMNSSIDNLNEYFLLDTTKCDVMKLNDEKSESNILISDTMGYIIFNTNIELKGRWLKSWQTSCHMKLFTNSSRFLYRAEIDIHDDATSFEMTGKMGIDEIVLNTSQIFSNSTVLPDWITNLSLHLTPPSDSMSFNWTSSVYITPTPNPHPSTLVFHSQFHSRILSSITPTSIVNVTDVKQWGMAIAVLRPEDTNITSPPGFIKNTYCWDVLVKHCTTQYMGIGVASLGTKYNSYLGRDFTGWSFQPTGEKWHSNVGYRYGPARPSYGEGDRISVELNMTEGTLAFFKNNTYLGIAFSGLTENATVAQSGLFPAVTSYRSGDCLELMGLRSGYIADLYPPTDAMRRTEWKQTWVDGMRHGYGIIEYSTGEKLHGIWKCGYLEGIALQTRKNDENNCHLMWYDTDICRGEATREEIRTILGIDNVLSIFPFSDIEKLSKIIAMTEIDHISTSIEIETNIVISGSGFFNHDYIFLLSSEHCAAGIELSDNLCTARCTTNNRCMVLGSRGFTSGKYYWEVRVNDCDYGTLFIGIASRLPGSSHQCWRDYGFVNNRSVQDHATENYYGVQFFKGDVIGVYLDMDIGQLSFFKEGNDFYYSHNNIIDLGMACCRVRSGNENIKQGIMLFPSFGFKRTGDCVSILNMKCVESDGVSARDMYNHYRFTYSFLRSLYSPLLSFNDSVKSTITERFYSLYNNNRISVKARGDIRVVLDTSQKALDFVCGDKAHFIIGQTVMTEKGQKRIVGCRNGKVWYVNENLKDFWYFNSSELLKQPICDKTNNEKPTDICDLSESVDWSEISSCDTIMSIVKYMNYLCDVENIDYNCISYQTVQNHPPSSPLHFLSKISLHLGICAIQILNDYAMSFIPLILLSTKSYPINYNEKKYDIKSRNFTNETPSSETLFKDFKSLYFFSVKRNILSRYLALTGNETSPTPEEFDRPITIPEIRVCRVSARRAVTSGLSSDDVMNQSILNQLVRGFEVFPISTFRREFLHAEDAGQKRSFFVRLIGEGVYDSGGPYREVISSAASDEAIHILGLAKPTANCENQISGCGEWFDIRGDEDVENKSDFWRLQYYWGVLIGIAIRDGITLNLPLSPLFWKVVVSESLCTKDIGLSDLSVINAIQHWDDVVDAMGSVQEAIDIIPLRKEAKLKMKKMLENDEKSIWKEELINEVISKYLDDLSRVVRGIGCIIPLEICSIFTPDEMRMVICGSNHLTTSDIKSIAEYGEGTDENCDAITMFWNVVDSLTEKDRSILLEFVCARSRIPAPPHPPISFKILLLKSGDDILPQSQTCFSILKLPRYSCEEVMRKQILYAIYNTPTMELDVQLHTADGWD